MHVSSSFFTAMHLGCSFVASTKMRVSCINTTYFNQKSVVKSNSLTRSSSALRLGILQAAGEECSLHGSTARLAVLGRGHSGHMERNLHRLLQKRMPLQAASWACVSNVMWFLFADLQVSSTHPLATCNECLLIQSCLFLQSRLRCLCHIALSPCSTLRSVSCKTECPGTVVGEHFWCVASLKQSFSRICWPWCPTGSGSEGVRVKVCQQKWRSGLCPDPG